MIAFPCPTCQNTLKAPEEKIGARTMCPHCRSAVQVPGTDEWYIVYHRHPLGTTGPNQRVMAVDRMTFDAEGNIQPVIMTSGGAAARRLPKAAR